MGAANTRFHVCRGRREGMTEEDGKREGMKGEGVRRRRRKVRGNEGMDVGRWEDEGKDGRG